MLAKSLLIWCVLFAGEHSPYHADARSLPVVVFQSDAQIDEGAGMDAEAWTDRDGTIYMPNKCRAMESTFCVGVLIHEAVHFLQYRKGDIYNADCLGPYELEAYRAEDAYYRTRGETLGDYGISPVELAVITMCQKPFP